VIEAEDEELDTHFVDNPFIKIRERALKRTLDAKIHLGQEDLENDGQD
jgi:hypothetical protein